MKYLLLLLLNIYFLGKVLSQEKVSGIIINAEDGKPLPGATIRLPNSNISVISDVEGVFNLSIPKGRHVLLISFVGYESLSLSIEVPLKKQLIIGLKKFNNHLNEVVVNTGYQKFRKEHVTGSFVTLDSTLINRSVGTNVIDRLADITPGLIFNKGRGATSRSINIRGQSTIFSNSEPLIVLDNFPYNGNLDNINPNDVESISILRDAAAAAIWGAKASNGVIVITSKSGKMAKIPVINFNANITVGNKPDPFYESKMSVSNFIDMEVTLFNDGFFKAKELSTSKPALTPVVELLISKRDGLIDEMKYEQQIKTLKGYDFRNDLNEYWYRQSINQQYFLSAAGGTNMSTYYMSLGYDHIKSNDIGNLTQRLTVTANHNYKFLKNKLELTSGFYFNILKNKNNNTGISDLNLSAVDNYIYPYARLRDEQGENLNINHDYNNINLEIAEKAGLLKWRYSPLEEIGLRDYRNVSTESRLNLKLKYRPIHELSTEVIYQYGQIKGEKNYLNKPESYFTRNLINRFTQSSSSGLTYPIPMGAILDLGNSIMMTHHLRLQAMINKSFSDRHNMTVLVGAELNDEHSQNKTNRLYGYDDDLAIAQRVDLQNTYPQYFGGNISLPYLSDISDRTDRYLSYFSSGTYMYSGKYNLTMSARLDQSNLFGVKSNQKGVPLWSAGISWLMHKEPWYRLNWLDEMKIRLTYGYNGNVNKNISAYTTARYTNGSDILTRQPYAIISNPPNDNLRWEKVAVFNSGIDLSVFKSRLNINIDYYRKKGIDLIGYSTYPSSSGITVFFGNTATTKGSGFDVNISSRNTTGLLLWDTDFFLSHSKDLVVKYLVKEGADYYASYGDLGQPLEGKPLYAVYSYDWAGLDPKNGDPRGILNGEISKQYADIFAAASPENIIYNGSARPLYFGSLRNTIAFKGFSISANISYRLGYYYRRNSVDYSAVLKGRGSHGDYALRWQKPGDELITNVPSFPVSNSDARNRLYLYSKSLVEKADHIRLQDIRIGYDFNKNTTLKLPFTTLQLYGYLNNIGILWKASSANEDPDYQLKLIPLTIAFGLKGTF